MLNSSIMASSRDLHPVLRDLSLLGVNVLEARIKPEIGACVITDNDPRDKLGCISFADATEENGFMKYYFKGLIIMWRLR